MSLVMRLETAAAKLERERRIGDIDKAELVDLLKEAAKYIKRLEGLPVRTRSDWVHETHDCGSS